MKRRLPALSGIPHTLALTLALCLPLSACAREETLLDVSIVDVDQGEQLSPIPYRGRDYIAGQPGHRFAVTMQNLSGERVLAVLSVDGVNAISGQTAGASQAGYVLEPWQRVEIRGWRKSYADIAEFYFTDLPDSYAARTGRPDNVGVIGVAAFRERRLQAMPYSPPAPMISEAGKAMAERSSADAAGGRDESRARRQDGASAPSAMAQQIGTGHGQRRYDPVAQTQFERDSTRPNQRIALYYDSFEALASRGIMRTRNYGQPEPFPLGFVPDPY
jgi:hypothetical protein